MLLKHKDDLIGKEFQISSLFTKTINASDDGSVADSITIEGYASTGNKDRSSDIIDPSVWNKEESLGNYRKNPIILAFHDHKRPIGTCDSITVDAQGLKIKATIHRSADESTFDMIAKGVLKAFSVGFRLKDLRYNGDNDAFYLTDLELFEISVVSVPDNQDSLFSLAKSLDVSNAELKQLFVETNTHKTNKTITHMDPIELQKMIAAQLAEAKAIEDKAKAEAAAREAEKAALAAEVVKQVTASIGTSGADRLSADIKSALEANNATIAETLKKFEADISEKKAELEAMAKSKMAFGSQAGSEGPVSQAERMNAVLLAKCLRKGISETAYGKSLKEKAAGFNTSNAAVHIPGVHTINDADWETEFTTQMYMDIRRDLVIEPLFRTIEMNAATMRIPVVPEQGYASYIAANNLRSANSTGPVDSGNRPTELTLTAHKLSAADLIGMEEQEDTILPILPLIRENLARRMARTSDRSLLRGVGATAADPIKGLASYADDAGADAVSLDISAGDKLTALKLQQARRQLGYFGMRPSDVAYIVSTAGYYDLLEDPDMRKYFDVGPTNATILTGEVARVNGSPILVSDEFAGAVAGEAAVVIVNMRNFILGNLRGMTVKTDDLVKEDSMLLVATRRFGMLQMETGAVARINYVD